VEGGTVLGLIGKNGSGKTSILQVIAGILSPQHGTVSATGQVVPLLAISAGLVDNLSGWDNLTRLALLHRFVPASIPAAVSQAATFSELGSRLNDPVSQYSNGMRLRLAFSLVTAQEPAVLLLVEVVGVGDAEFQEKARMRIRDLQLKAGVAVVASHSQDYLKRNCSQLAWIDKGAVKMIGETNDVLSSYQTKRGFHP